MSLLRIHKLLIAMAILLCACFAARAVANSSGAIRVLCVATAATAGSVLALYLRWLLRNEGYAVDAAASSSKSQRDN
jgi:hypothetical protein